MGLREDALLQIVGLDAARAAQLTLRVAQNAVRAESGALLAIDGDRPAFFATTEMVLEDTQRIDECWRDSREQLLLGHASAGNDWAIAPLGRPAKGLLYLGRAGAILCVDSIQRLIGDLGHMLEASLAMRDRESEIRICYEAMIARTPLRLLTRDKVVFVLKANDWNKSRAARDLGITRATLYRWMEAHDVEDGP